MGTLEEALADHNIIGVDTMPFIYLWERHPHYLSLSESLFRYLKEPDVRGITSLITLVEACVLPQRQGREDLVQKYERILLHSRQVETLPIDAAVARRAIVLRARHNLRVPDSLQVAAALEAGATAFVTNDRQLEKVPELAVLVLDDYLA
ncbi:MAG: PIN domain-containing protein [Anaerolineae bacterium]|nr:PIN domain-containing protein [Anaerolineae bacterium]